jgi:molecular chaperone HscA
VAKISINLQKAVVEKEKTKGEVIVGIDLGTTNSLVAYINSENKAVTVKDNNSKNALVPSVLWYNNNQFQVGDIAKEKLLTDPHNCIFSVKRLMGKSYKDLSEIKDFFSYKIIENENEDGLVRINVNDKFYSPIELSAKILSELKNRVENLLGQPVQKAVITVPAYFNDAQRQATRDAGKLAGLDVLRIINEPTAASLAYGIGLNKDEVKTIAVYDLGGGTFDVSILRIDNGIFEVLSTHGDTFLGGDDFDYSIIKYWASQNALNVEELLKDTNKAQILRFKAEKAKIALNDSDIFNEIIEGINLRISRAEFESVSKNLLQKTLDSCSSALRDARITKDQIDEVVLVGGSTRMYLVKKAVNDFFGKTIIDTINPDEVVALGAAIQADILAGNQKDMLLLDVTPLSLGIETLGGLMDVIIPRNSKIPIKSGRQYTTSKDGQSKLKISVYQGERDLVADNRQLGEFILSDIPPMPAGIPKIEIHFLLNADGILKVRAKELRSGVEQTVEMKSPYGISEEEMAKMLLDSIKNAQSDLEIRALIEARTEANHVLSSTEKFITQNAGLFDEDQFRKLREYIQLLEEAVNGSDKDRIQQIMNELNDYARPLAEIAMDHTVSEAMRGKALQ